MQMPVEDRIGLRPPFCYATGDRKWSSGKSRKNGHPKDLLNRGTPSLPRVRSAWAAGSFVVTHAGPHTIFLRNFVRAWLKFVDITFSFFFRSCCSWLLLFIVFLIIAGIGPRTYIASWPPGRLIPGLAFLILGNFVPDYLSLLETRFLVRRMDGSSTLLRVALFLMVDFVATIIVFGLVNPPISFMRFVSVGIADVDKLIADIPHIPSKFVEIVPLSHRQGNCIPYAAIRWHDFGNRPALGRPLGHFSRHPDTPLLSLSPRRRFPRPTPERVFVADHQSSSGFSGTGPSAPPPQPIGT